MNDLAKRFPAWPKQLRRYRTENLDDAYEDGWYDALDTVEEFAADVAPIRHGEWINEKCRIKSIFAEYCYECSLCGRPTGFDRYPMTNYCPGCGAEMRREIGFTEGVVNFETERCD